MAIFNTDLEAIIYIALIGFALYLFNQILILLLNRIRKISAKYRIITKFSLQLLSFGIIIYLIIEGFPSYDLIDPAYTAILTSSIATAVAFASSGVFSNLVSGIVLIFIRPFDVGDLVKIKGEKGIVRSIKLTHTKIETFDNILVQKSNTEVISSKVTNYTIKFARITSFNDFKKKLQSPLDKGMIDIDLVDDSEMERYEQDLREVYEKFPKRRTPNLYVYTFRMEFPYKGFKSIINKVDILCQEYKDKEIFLLKPRFHVVDFGFTIIVKFRILTFYSDKIFEFQPKLAEDVHKIIVQQNIVG